MATIDILGVRHTYELTNPTKSPHALVFIHGWLLSRGYWQPLIKRLSPDYQCLAYDLRGFGQSQSKPSLSLNSRTLVATPESAKVSGYNPAAYAQDLVIMLQQLNITSAWLIGHSLGGTIALWTAEQLPEQVKGVICVNAGGGIYLKEAFEQFRSTGKQLLKFRPRWLSQLPLIDLIFTRANEGEISTTAYQFRSTGKQLLKFRPRWLSQLPLIDLIFTRANVVQAIARSWGRQRVIDFVIAHPEAALGALLDSTTEEEINRLPQVVSQLKQPVYFLAGSKDQIMEPKYVRHLASFHPLFRACGDNVIEIPHCGHLAMLEQPDAVATQIRAFLTQDEIANG